MNTFTIVLTLVLAVGFLGAGATKLLGMKPHPEEFERFGLPGLSPAAARIGTGLIETLAAALLIVGAVVDSSLFALAGAVLVVCTMIGALSTHLRLRDSPPQLVPAAFLGALGVAVAILTQS